MHYRPAGSGSDKVLECNVGEKISGSSGGPEPSHKMRAVLILQRFSGCTGRKSRCFSQRHTVLTGPYRFQMLMVNMTLLSCSDLSLSIKN